MYHIRDYLRKKYQIKVEPYWNVNITHFNPSILGISIKVEPYWNVNQLINQKEGGNVAIKVEPYWNVNTERISARFEAS